MIAYKKKKKKIKKKMTFFFTESSVNAIEKQITKYSSKDIKKQ
jgi:hypothetical protein